MKIQESAENLRQLYDGAAEREEVIPIHLFGIKFARQLGGLTNEDLVRRTGLPESYHSEDASYYSRR